jgi:hypothetical protein
MCIGKAPLKVDTYAIHLDPPRIESDARINHSSTRSRHAGKSAARDDGNRGYQCRADTEPRGDLEPVVQGSAQPAGAADCRGRFRGGAN